RVRKQLDDRTFVRCKAPPAFAGVTEKSGVAQAFPEGRLHPCRHLRERGDPPLQVIESGMTGHSSVAKRRPLRGHDGKEPGYRRLPWMSASMSSSPRTRGSSASSDRVAKQLDDRTFVRCKAPPASREDGWEAGCPGLSYGVALPSSTADTSQASNAGSCGGCSPLPASSRRSRSRWVSSATASS